MMYESKDIDKVMKNIPEIKLKKGKHSKEETIMFDLPDWELAKKKDFI